VLGLIGIFFQVYLTYFTSGAATYIGVYFALLGVGGTYNVLYCLIEARVPAHRLGNTLTALNSAAIVSSSFAPLIVSVTAPMPLFIVLILFISAIIMTMALPEPNINLILDASEKLSE